MLFLGLLFASSVNGAGVEAANEMIEQRLAAWVDTADPGRLRMQIATDAVVEALVRWDVNGERIHPPQRALPHVLEAGVLADLERLTALRREAQRPVWELVTRGSERYYQCHRSRCVVVNGNALAEALGWAPDGHRLLVTPSASGVSSRGWAISVAFGVLLLAFAAIGLKHRRTSEPVDDADAELAFVFGPVRVDARRMCVIDGDIERDLTHRELRILQVFARQPNVVFSKAELYERVWGRAYQASSRALDQQIRTLRSKLDPTRVRKSLIETVHARGYRYRL